MRPPAKNSRNRASRSGADSLKTRQNVMRAVVIGVRFLPRSFNRARFFNQEEAASNQYQIDLRNSPTAVEGAL